MNGGVQRNNKILFPSFFCSYLPVWHCPRLSFRSCCLHGLLELCLCVGQGFQVLRGLRTILRVVVVDEVVQVLPRSHGTAHVLVTCHARHLGLVWYGCYFSISIGVTGNDKCQAKAGRKERKKKKRRSKKTLAKHAQRMH